MMRLLMVVCIMMVVSNVFADSLLDSLKSESLKKSATFVQRKYIEAFDEVMVSKGRMQVLDNGFSIDYSEPFKYSLAYDGVTIKNTNHDMKTESVINVKENPVMMVVMNYFNQIINLQFDQLDKDFNITESGPRLILHPKNETLAKYVKNIEIQFKLQSISSVTIHASGKEYTTFDIQNVN